MNEAEGNKQRIFAPLQTTARPPAQSGHNVHSTDLWADCLDAWTFSLNLQRFRTKLEETVDQRQRAVLTDLICEYERKFHDATASSGLDGPVNGSGA